MEQLQTCEPTETLKADVLLHGMQSTLLFFKKSFEVVVITLCTED